MDVTWQTREDIWEIYIAESRPFVPHKHGIYLRLTKLALLNLGAVYFMYRDSLFPVSSGASLKDRKARNVTSQVKKDPPMQFQICSQGATSIGLRQIFGISYRFCKFSATTFINTARVNPDPIASIQNCPIAAPFNLWKSNFSLGSPTNHVLIGDFFLFPAMG